MSHDTNLPELLKAKIKAEIKAELKTEIAQYSFIKGLFFLLVKLILWLYEKYSS